MAHVLHQLRGITLLGLNTFIVQAVDFTVDCVISRQAHILFALIMSLGIPSTAGKYAKLRHVYRANLYLNVTCSVVADSST
jgi:hypothetical protein